MTTPVDEEAVYIRRAQAGDQRAFAWLVGRYQTPVYNLCYRMLGTPDEAQDAAQETFLRAYSKLRTFEEGRKFSSWLLSIGSHHCIDCLRRRRFAWVDIDEMAGVLPDRREEQPEEVALRSESEATIQRLLKTLPPDYRTVVILYYWNQLSYEEIGQILNISEPAIKSRLHRARRALADKLAASQRPERRLAPAPAAQV